MLVFVSLHGFINVYLSCTWKTSPLLLKAYPCHYVSYVFVSVCVCVCLYFHPRLQHMDNMLFVAE